MKILFVSSDFARTGASLAMTELAEEVKRIGHDVLLLFPARSNAVDDAERRGLDCRVIRSYEWLAPLDRRESLLERIRWALKHLWNRIAIRQISRLIKEQHIDIVHNNSLWGYVGAVAAKRTRTPCVWHMREMLERQQNKKLRGEKYGQHLISESAALIAISRAVERYYEGRFLPVQTHLVYDGVDVDKMYREKHDLFHEAKTKIIAAGRVHKPKHQMDVVQAVAILLHKGLNVELAIVGNDNSEYAETIKAFVRKEHLERSISFHGESSDMVSWWEKSDIAVTASQFEAFGRVTAEAMLAGCVVVASNSGANEEIVTDGETGYVYEMGNPEALAATLERIMSDKEKAAQCAAAGRESVVRRFGSEKNAREVVAIYDAILKKHAHRAFPSPMGT